MTRLRASESFDVALVGGGFSGTLVAVQLARLSRKPLRIAMFDRNGAFGRGTAYMPSGERYILNVRAKAMGAFPDAEDDFLHWLNEREYASRDADLGERFLPRRVYGDYLRSLLDRSTTGNGTHIEEFHTEVVAIAPSRDGYELETGAGDRVWAASVVLAIGNLPFGGWPPGMLADAMARHARNPWDFITNGALHRDAEVLIVGTGLSALDVVSHLASHGHAGKIMMLSRRGRFPLPHAETSHAPALGLPGLTGGPLDVLRAVRGCVREAAVSGTSWHAIVDGLRPQINTLWQRWTREDRLQFYRHLEPMWEIHRHRAPQSTLEFCRAAIVAGRLRGRLVSVESHASRLRATYAVPGEASARSINVDTVVDCTGPRRHLRMSGDPLVECILARGLARPGPLGVGLAVAPDGALEGSAPSQTLFTLGMPVRGTLAESTAVREIRVQARTVAEAILARGAARIASCTKPPLKVGLHRSDVGDEHFSGDR